MMMMMMIPCCTPTITIASPRVIMRRRRRCCCSTTLTPTAVVVVVGMVMMVATCSRVDAFSSSITRTTTTSEIRNNHGQQRVHAAVLLPLFSTTTTSSVVSSSITTTDEDLISKWAESTSPNALWEMRRNEYYSYGLDEYNDEYDNDDDEDEQQDWDANVMEQSVSRFHHLQQSMGSEIIQSELQRQIDLGPRAFLEQQQNVNDDAMEKEPFLSDIERVAMSTITEQLPQPAVTALRRQKQQKSLRPAVPSTTTTKTLTTSSSITTSRQVKPSRTTEEDSTTSKKSRLLTAEQEQQLGRIIQIGVAVNKVRSEFETRHQRSMTSQEWAKAVQLSNKELRQTISAYRQAKHDLVTANMGLVHAVVQQQWGTAAAKAVGISKEELVQEGSLGLLRAAELFDPSRGVRFSTYAVVWIKGVLSNSHVPELVRVPSRERTKWNKIVRAQRDLIMAGGGGDGTSGVTVTQLAQATGLSVPEIMETQLRMNQASNVLSLDYQYQIQSRSGERGGSGGSSSSSLESTMDLDRGSLCRDEADLVLRTQLTADIVAAMARNLNPREARLVRLRYGLSDGHCRTLQECADAMGLSYSRIHQLNERCLTKLRQADEAQSLEEYLLTIA